jgi:hypothetical protein
MASGFIKARARLSAGVNTALYTVPAATGAAVNINVANHGPNAATVKIAITDGGAPADGDWIETGHSVSLANPLLRTNEPMAAGEVIYVQASTDTVDVRVSGYEEDV